jgi:hypothetical protein
VDTTQLHPDLNDIELEALRRAVAEADAAARAGRIVSHDRVRPWLLGLAQGKRTLRPKSE